MRRLFYVIVALQLLFLIGQAALNEITLRTADVVYLRIVPVDPRSLFMGNYMDLSYDISSIDLTRVSVSGPRNRSGFRIAVFVGLRPSKPFARLVAVSNRMPSNPRGLVWLRGTVTGSWDRSMMRVEYGLERYYIPDGKEDEVAGLQWRREGRRRQITVEVAVRGDGIGFIRRVLVDGKPLPFSPESVDYRASACYNKAGACSGR